MSTGKFRAIDLHDLSSKPKIDFLIATATDPEREAMLAHFQALPGDEQPLKVFHGVATYYIGKVGRHPCVLITSEKGAGGRGGATLAANAAIELWKPYATIAVGIAFGVDENKGPGQGKQKIRDVLVSEKLIPYEIQRVGKDEVVYRGPKPECGQILLDRTKHLDWTWEDDAHERRKPLYGPLFAGDKLIDNMEFRDKLVSDFPDAIGGEMEGYGIYSAAERHKVEWIVVKAICDWGDGSKTKTFQKSAAENAASLVAHLLGEPGLGEHHFRKQSPTGTDAVVQSFGSEASVTRIRDTERARMDANARLAEFIEKLPVVDGLPRLSTLEKGEYTRLVKAREAANESWLNAYNDACARYLNSTLNRGLFKEQFLVEICQIFEIEGPHSIQLRPRAKSPYGSLWKVYMEWQSETAGALVPLAEVPSEIALSDTRFESIHLLTKKEPLSEDEPEREHSLDDGWLMHTWHPVEEPVSIRLHSKVEQEFRAQVERVFSDDKGVKEESRRDGIYLVSARNALSDYHRIWGISAAGSLLFKSRVGRGRARKEPLGYVLLDLIRFLILVREHGFGHDYPGPGILSVHLSFPAGNVTRETPQSRTEGDVGLGFDRGTLAIDFPPEEKPRYGPLSLRFNVPLRDLVDDKVSSVAANALGLAVRDYFGATVDEDLFAKDAADLVDEIRQGRRFWTLPEETIGKIG